MRTGAIFARGSCRALKWVALLGVVFALAAGQAVAQQTLTNGSLELEVDNSDEGSTTTVTVTVTADVEPAAVGSGVETTVVVNVSAATTGLDAAALSALGPAVTVAEAEDFHFRQRGYVA